MIIGITGTFSSGKDTVARYLESKGFKHISTGDLVRAEVSRRGLPLDRDTQRQVANELRRKHGPGYLAALALQEIGSEGVVSGLRNVEEVKVLKERSPDAFFLIAVDAPARIRYERARVRGRIGDEVSFQTFQVQERLEKSLGPERQQIDEVVAMADLVIQNDGTEEELYDKVEKILAKLERKA